MRSWVEKVDILGWNQSTVYVSKYACYMSLNDFWVSVVSLTAQVNGRQTEKVSLLKGKETDNRQTETNRHIRHTQYRLISYRRKGTINIAPTWVYERQGSDIPAWSTQYWYKSCITLFFHIPWPHRFVILLNIFWSCVLTSTSW